LPPTNDEQTAIASVLSDVDALLAALNQVIVKKRDMKQAVMYQLLTGKTRLSGFDTEWQTFCLGDLSIMSSGGTPLSSVASYYGGGIPWVSISDMTDAGKYILSTSKNLTKAGLASSAAQIFPSGTVLYAMYASLGECSIAGVSLCTSQAILGIQPNKNLNNEYLYYYLTSLKNMVKAMGQQGTQSNLNKGMVKNFRINLPSLDEQKAIAVILSDMDHELLKLEERLNKTQELKQAMMQELLTGKKRLINEELSNA
jgi:type I restriction enzyme S subunit